MMQLMVENIFKTIGDKQLFNNISFTIGEKERVGLIGINGTGKSTLLKILANAEDVDRGKITMPKDYRIGLLSQVPILDGERTILEQVLSSDLPVNRIVFEYEEALKELNKQPDDPKRQNVFFEKQKRMDDFGGWEIITKAKTILTKLGLHQIHEKIKHLSGGQKKRVALAEVLVDAPNLLLLDEPTNHLDAEMIEWLEEILNNYEHSVIFVTHDRYFLDSVATKIFELNDGKLYSYKGNYADYLEAKAKREEEESRQREKLQNLYRRELAWIKRGAKARSTKQKARIQRFEKINEALEDQKARELDIFYKGTRLGKSVIEMKGCFKSFGEKTILNDFHLLVKSNERIGIVGNNGSGKTTLLNILSGKEPLDAGTLTIGQTVKFAYYTQHASDMDGDKRIIDYIQETKSFINAGNEKMSASRMLERFLFPPKTHGTFIRKLSGGERKRLYLLKLLMDEPNVLLLDEPTNDLDTETLTVLEQFLEEFPGVVITVSHDRYFLDKVCDRILFFHGDGQIESFYGCYTDFLTERKTRNEEKVEEEKPKKKNVFKEDKPKGRKLSYKEKMEWETIDEKIKEAEQELERIQRAMDEAGSDFEKIHQLYEEEEKWNNELERLIERWAYLSDLIGE
ncbi:ABC-F family ATP-binding cassette domain-containing protein [Fervidibacillus halotolerans]|uniref:ABC-F family ATP-binding cassette domain-containing protein n=1 Tax=Fervidibacillus halotolerans TaxID=2980027 RepID=A0A9E8M0S6_9BACI|nr:ABC-F family ATP-binding cassette domain-containing protein [Fervidibacillus halotolerans]WAA13272.1 ABC-F family ATP-binding cassette domain-containing protein [Fervidibacillus halotolerans]